MTSRQYWTIYDGNGLKGKGSKQCFLIMLRIVGVVGLSLLYESVHSYTKLGTSGTNEHWGTYNCRADDDHCCELNISLAVDVHVPWKPSIVFDQLGFTLALMHTMTTCCDIHRASLA